MPAESNSAAVLFMQNPQLDVLKLHTIWSVLVCETQK